MGACGESCKAHGDLFAIKSEVTSAKRAPARAEASCRGGHMSGERNGSGPKKVFRVGVTLHPALFPGFCMSCNRSHAPFTLS